MSDEPTFDPAPLELTLIGFALAYPGRFYDIEGLRGDHFQVPTNRKVFMAMLKLYHEVGAAALETPSMIADQIVDYGVPMEESLRVFTMARDFAPGNPEAIRGIRDRLITKALRQCVGDAAKEIGELAGHTDVDQDKLSAESQRILTDALRVGSTVEMRRLLDVMDDEVRRFDPDTPDEDMGFSTGLAALDQQIAGLHGGELLIIGGRPGMGKSSLLNHIVMALAYEQELPGVIFSLEMRASEWAQRLVATKSKCNIQDVRLKTLGPHRTERYLEWAQRIRDAPLWVYDGGSITMSRIASTCRRMVHEHGIRWVGVDYLQLLDHQQGRNQSTNDAIGHSSRAAKSLALSLDVPVIMLSQLNRDCEKRPDKRPMLSDLRSSGSIEQDADAVIFLYRAEHYHEGDAAWRAEHQDERGVAELIVAKQRNGPVGTVKAAWAKECAAFGNLDHDGRWSDGGEPEIDYGVPT